MITDFHHETNDPPFEGEPLATQRHCTMYQLGGRHFRDRLAAHRTAINPPTSARTIGGEEAPSTNTMPPPAPSMRSRITPRSSPGGDGFSNRDGGSMPWFLAICPTSPPPAPKAIAIAIGVS